MEYSFSQLSSIAKSLRERYPIGTRIKLISMGDDPRPIPPGTKGTVEGIDDIATVFCRFDNGRSLGLAYGEDHYRALTQAELLEEKCARNYDKYYEAVHRDIFADVDLDRFANEIENANDNYTIEILKQLHDKFVEIYDTDSVDGLVGFIQVPAIVESLQTGDYYPALVTLDLDSSGEHWGTEFLTPYGIISQNDPDLDNDMKKYIREQYIPYDYWYTADVENDIHISFDDIPEAVADLIDAARGEEPNMELSIKM